MFFLWESKGTVGPLEGGPPQTLGVIHGVTCLALINGRKEIRNWGYNLQPYL